MTGPTAAQFPALGFDPAPGDAGAATELSNQLAKAVASLQEGHQLIAELSSSDSADWQGSAAEEFRQHLSGDLPTALQNAHDSMAKAQQALAGWGPQLIEYQMLAASLEVQAEQEKQQLQQAQGGYEQAQQNPNLGFFTQVDVSLTPEQIQAAGDARAQVLQSEAQLQEYQAQLEATIRRAQELAQEHDVAAGKVAQELQSAPNGLAPHKPGWLHRAVSWLHSHAKVIGNVLSALSAVAGLLAMIPPLTVVCAPLAIGLSAAALGMQLWGGDHNPMDLAGDALGMIPGIGALGDAFKGASAAAKGADGLIDGVKAADGALDTARAGLSGTWDTVKAGAEGWVGSVSKLRYGTPMMQKLATNVVSRLPVVFDDSVKASQTISKAVTGLLDVKKIESNTVKAVSGA